MRQHAQGCLQRPWFVVGLLTLALLHAPMTAAETQDVVVVNFDQAKEPVPHGWELSEKEGKADLALVPLVIAGDIPGHEIELPLAVVVLGGLVIRHCSTCLLYLPYTCVLGRIAAALGPSIKRKPLTSWIRRAVNETCQERGIAPCRDSK